MKRHWRLRRQTTPLPDGQQRWDQAYQQVLQSTLVPPPTFPSTPALPLNQEDHHAHSHLHPRLDLEPGARPDD